ncbi:MAG TPA: serine/threonine protein kinase [Burkholderiales bacterium]|jgi:Ser/Thr protein kinase RdoA (MazF antagonist)|nr:serine/threonine protein kinase [Burkholderiales bacterium]
MSEPLPPPYAGLTPEAVLDAVESLGLFCDGRQLTLNSYENRVYQVGIEDSTPLIAKFYRPARWSDAQIHEEHSFLAELAQAEVPVVAPLAYNGTTLHSHGGFRFALFPRRGGRAPELEDPEVLEWMGRFMARIHTIGSARPFDERPTLDPITFGFEPRDWLLTHGFIPPDLLEAWTSTAQHALDAIARCYEAAGDFAMLRLHGDCHSGNVLWTDGGPHFVDFDDARSGPAVQDLWMLLPGDPAAIPQAWKHLLAGYEQFRDFDDNELHLVEALRTLRLLHYSYWLARRWEDPAFPAAFPWFNTARYWQDRILELREQLSLMQEAPLRPAR